MTTVKMIDPPSGWKYGFPKALPDHKPECIHQWLLDNGYPQEEIDKHSGGYFYYRVWEEEQDDNSK